MIRPLDLAGSLRGPFSFLRPDDDDLRRLGADEPEALPLPQRIFLALEDATPVPGFPVLQSVPTRALREALEAYVHSEEELELGLLRGHSPDRRSADAAWEYYRTLLARATENVVSSSFGRGYASIFWLYHSIAIARQFKEVPLRVRRRHLDLGRDRGDEIKYRVFHRYLDRVLHVVYDIVERVSQQTEEAESELFPTVLDRMRDNVLILTEDHVSPDLGELASFLRGYLQVDPREFRGRLEALHEWYEQRAVRYPTQHRALRHLFGSDEEPRRAFTRPGFVSYLAESPGYDADRLLPLIWVPIWENLLLKLKEFELLSALRRLVVPILQDEEGRLHCSAASIGWNRSQASEVALSGTTRPLDFMTPWVVEPQVQRFGLVYDITDFSAVISTLGRAGSELQDDSFRRFFAFQRRINAMARSHRLRLEKYLGDGAFYSARSPRYMLAAAVQLQRYYRRALEEGFPFDRGMRIALNYGRYRLLPIDGSGETGSHRYEFFGHGIIELSRLVTGKSAREIEDMKTLLVSRGYPPREVERFFAPIERRHVYLVDKLEEARAFFAYINPSGILVNEGIVVTSPLIAELDHAGGTAPLALAVDGHRRYISLEVVGSTDETVRVGLRKLGVAGFKGLGETSVYELVDGADWSPGALERLPETSLAAATERLFAETAVARAAPSPG